MTTETIKKGAILKVAITGCDPEGLGIVQYEGYLLLVHGGLPGDCATVCIDYISQHKKVAWSHIIQVHVRGSWYRKPKCIHLQNDEKTTDKTSCDLSSTKTAEEVQTDVIFCGGCPLAHIGYVHQTRLKKERVQRLMDSIGFVSGLEWTDAPFESFYRNRSNFVPCRDKTGQVYLGSYVPRGHHVAPMSDCRICRRSIKQVQIKIARLLNNLSVPIFPASGSLRYVTIRANKQDEVLVNLVVNAAKPHWLPGFSKALQQIKSVVGLSVTLNASKGNAIRGTGSQTLWGETAVTEHLGEVPLLMQADTFSQLNSDVAELMYKAAAQFCGDLEVVWDLYCGVGGLGFYAGIQNKAGRLYGADAIGASIDLANATAQRLVKAGQLTVNPVFEVVDLSQKVPISWPEPDVILVNPPRRGLDKPIVQLLCEFGDAATLKKMVYMSCNPKSFAQDAKQLLDAGWTIKKVQAYDMLPQTTHVELLAFFEHMV